MIRDILEVLVLVVVVILMLFEICAVVLSGKISEEERKNDKKRINGGK